MNNQPLQHFQQVANRVSQGQQEAQAQGAVVAEQAARLTAQQMQQAEYLRSSAVIAALQEMLESQTAERRSLDPAHSSAPPALALVALGQNPAAAASYAAGRAAREGVPLAMQPGHGGDHGALAQGHDLVSAYAQGPMGGPANG